VVNSSLDIFLIPNTRHLMTASSRAKVRTLMEHRRESAILHKLLDYIGSRDEEFKGEVTSLQERLPLRFLERHLEREAEKNSSARFMENPQTEEFEKITLPLDSRSVGRPAPSRNFFGERKD
jgi:hypothetical protein